MVLKLAIFIAAVFWGHIKANAIESNFHYEESCAAKSGFCVLENECPENTTSDLKTLCPAQRSAGAICCPNVKQEDINCFQLHNDCRNECPSSLTLGTKGCPQGSVCCVLV